MNHEPNKNMLTKPFEAYERPGLVISYKLAEGVRVFKGALLVLDENGFCLPYAGVLACGVSPTFIGVACESVKPSCESFPVKTINAAKSGSFVYRAHPSYTPELRDLGKEAYACSDWQVMPLPAGHRRDHTVLTPVGTIVGIEITSTGEPGVRIRIDRHTF
jgi:hypothetical protein